MNIPLKPSMPNWVQTANQVDAILKREFGNDPIPPWQSYEINGKVYVFLEDGTILSDSGKIVFTGDVNMLAPLETDSRDQAEIDAWEDASDDWENKDVQKIKAFIENAGM